MIKKLMSLLFKKEGEVVINGKSYSGRNVQVIKGNGNIQVSVDGSNVSVDSDLELNIQVNGSVEHLETASGNVFASNIGSVETASGAVDCGDVEGNVSTVSGKVRCKDISGSVSTVSGKITKGNW